MEHISGKVCLLTGAALVVFATGATIVWIFMNRWQDEIGRRERGERPHGFPVEPKSVAEEKPEEQSIE